MVNSSFDNSTEENYYYKELLERVEVEVNHLPPKCRNVFELSRKQYKTNKEIAQLMGISEKTVENHLTKALRYLRVNLNSVLLLTFLYLRK
jgi:RNA polymerase sigma-70 factor (ECF subfamily)